VIFAKEVSLTLYTKFTDTIENETLKNIDMIQIEYHYGYSDLVEKLKKAGFYLEYTEPKYSYNKETENPNMWVGYIYAKRI